MSSPPRTRPKYYDLNLFHLPPPGLVSILHRASGMLLFILIVPVLLFALQSTLSSEEAFNNWKACLSQTHAKIIILGFVWAYAHHFFAGIRYLLLDMHWGIELQSARTSAKVVLALGII